MPLARADTIYNNVILGGQVAIGNGATVNVIAGDLGSLMSYLEGVGVRPADRKALEEALVADRNTLGGRVKGWIGEIAIKAAA